MGQLKNIRKIQALLLKWYRANKRDLPWRKTRDPYAIWISEIMLQQTQVETVIPYFHKWLRKFPDVRSLARADEEGVLKAWEGLGYYSRARNLLRAAKEIVAKHGGNIPRRKEDILSLPGIGRYTAGAILSIAFGEPVPGVDGNVTRVLARLFNIHSDAAAGKTQKKIWDLARSLVPQKNPGDFNQALMELGATVCVPSAPRCLLCPLAGECLGLKKSDPSRLPIRNSKLKIRNFEGWIFLVERNGRYLIQKRPKGEVMGGLWEFPSTMDGHLKKPGKIIGKIKAAFTKYRGIYRVVAVGATTSLPAGQAGVAPTTRWVHPKNFGEFTFSAPSRKVLHLKGWAPFPPESRA